MTWTIIVLAILALVLWSFYISWRASRLDRLHNRVEAARTALDLALVRRASAASDLASSGLVDPATSLLLADAVRRARLANPAERDLAESDLTRALRATLGEQRDSAELEDGSPGAGDRAPGHRDGTRDGTAAMAATAAAAAGAAARQGAGTAAGAAQPGAMAASAGPVRAIPQEDGPPEEEGAEELFDEVEKAARQVFIARKFYNDVAGRTIDARRRPLARVLRLSGSAKQPEFFDMDDTLTDGDG
ncbi:hypothetical protein [Trebonia kvetii]|uniref:hypothetical protein n=1 Tax=Trebonia kvetii TaxID=2480626 RepID=UPI001651B592|nr:hypothetical protein [Trebonia kvetii]